MFHLWLCLTFANFIAIRVVDGPLLIGEFSESEVAYRNEAFTNGDGYCYAWWSSYCYAWLTLIIAWIALALSLRRKLSATTMWLERMRVRGHSCSWRIQTSSELAYCVVRVSQGWGDLLQCTGESCFSALVQIFCLLFSFIRWVFLSFTMDVPAFTKHIVSVSVCTLCTWRNILWYHVYLTTRPQG